MANTKTHVKKRHMFERSITIFSVVIMMTSSAFAQSQKTDVRPQAQRVVGDELLDAFKGVTHEGAYNFTREGAGTQFYTETHHDDGRTTYVEGDLKSDGVWIIQQDGLCFAYKDPAMTGGCFRVYKVGTCFYYYSREIPTRDDEIDRDYWTARSVPAGETATCEAVFS